MEDHVDKSSLCSNPPPEQAAGSVVYQLVRVGGDGTLIPATDDEVMEVEHILEDDKKDLPFTEGLGQSQGDTSNMALSSKKSSINGLEGSPRSENSEGNSVKLNARLEYIEVMLQKVKHEEKLRLFREAPIHSPKCNNVDRQSSDQHVYLPACNGFPQTGCFSEESAAQVTIGLDEGSGRQCPDSTETEQTASRALDAGIYSSSYPVFSLLEGEVCLDDLTIRELQETFRVMFGRQTSVKDKLWLRRRIAMGLTNSCDVPSTGFIINGRKIVVKSSKRGHFFRENTKNEVNSQTANQNIGSVEGKIQDLLSSPIGQVQEERSLTCKRLRASSLEDNSKSENLNMEIIGSKRVRKPTRRYIEELSEVEKGECCAQSITLVESSEQSQLPAKYWCRRTSSVTSQCATFITRKDFLGGCGVQIPYVLRVRRGRPRTNIVDVMSAALNQREKPVADTHRQEQASGNYLGDYADIVLRPKCSTRRKHHRAWTLCEVVKLVEGVSKYGAGRWSEIKRLAFPSYTYRTSVDLKDKWRNLLRACFTPRVTEKGALNSKKCTSAPIPMPILRRVRELAKMQFQEGIGFSSGKITGHNRRDLQGKRSGFL